jgi:hypothetical protein
MGKHANQSVYLEFERLDRKDEAGVVTEVRAPNRDSEHWARIRAEVEFFGSGK